MPGMATQEGGVLHPGAMGQHLQRGDGHNQPVPVDPGSLWVGIDAAGSVPAPGFPLEEAESLPKPNP